MSIDLETFLKNKGYSDDEILETVIRFDNGMSFPDVVKKDIYDFILLSDAIKQA